MSHSWSATVPLYQLQAGAAFVLWAEQLVTVEGPENQALDSTRMSCGPDGDQATLRDEPLLGEHLDIKICGASRHGTNCGAQGPQDTPDGARERNCSIDCLFGPVGADPHVLVLAEIAAWVHVCGGWEGEEKYAALGLLSPLRPVVLCFLLQFL